MVTGYRQKLYRITVSLSFVPHTLRFPGQKAVLSLPQTEHDCCYPFGLPGAAATCSFAHLAVSCAAKRVKVLQLPHRIWGHDYCIHVIRLCRHRKQAVLGPLVVKATRTKGCSPSALLIPPNLYSHMRDTGQARSPMTVRRATPQTTKGAVTSCVDRCRPPQELSRTSMRPKSTPVSDGASWYSEVGGNQEKGSRANHTCERSVIQLSSRPGEQSAHSTPRSDAVRRLMSVTFSQTRDAPHHRVPKICVT